MKDDKWYRLLHPKVAFLLLTQDSSGKVNVMTLAWAMPIDDEEKLLAISVWKGNYSFEILKETKEFVLCVPTKEMLHEVWFCGTKSGKEVDKVAELGLELEEGVKISVSHLKSCAGFLECKVEREIECGEHVLFISRVVYAGVRETLFDGTWKENSHVLMHVGGKRFASLEKLLDF